MSVLAGVGLSMMVGSLVTSPFLTQSSITKRLLKRYYKSVDLELVKILNVTKDRARVLIPLGLTERKFYEKSQGLELALQVPVLVKHDRGRIFTIDIAQTTLPESIVYDELMDTGELAVPLYTPFGLIYLDFNDEVCAHLLIGGATRMGKTVLLRLIVTHILLRTKGKAKFFFLDNKITDLVMFEGLPQFKLGETVEDARNILDDVRTLVEERRNMLKASGSVDGRHLDPVFVVIDEYGRFADDRDIQDRVTFIAETAGYLNIHLIIATQRPDATSAIKPRIKANLVTRFSFTTADETNSQIIIGVPDAAHLGRIQGRAIFMDGFPHTVQVPYISADFAKELVTPYARTRRENIVPLTPIQSVDSGAFGTDDFQPLSTPPSTRKSRVKKNGT